MYYFYALFSEKDLKYYYGSTSDLRRRMTEHTKGKVEATRYRLPLRLVYYEAYEELSRARKREKQVKASSAIRASLHKRFNSVG